MKEDNVTRLAICPRCGKAYHGPPALSREDNETLICPDCGTRQALSPSAWSHLNRSRSLRQSTAIRRSDIHNLFLQFLYRLCSELT